MTEPTTLLTDYALGAVSVALGVKLIRHSKLWALAFLALAAAAFLGGTWHGLWQSELLWKATTLSVGVASFGMVAGSAFLTTTGAMRHLLVIFAALKCLAYTVWMLGHDDFIWVVADTGIALALVGLMHLERFNGWMLAGVAVSLLAGLVQASGVALHPRFNHNDFYHVIQIAAMFLFYRGLKKASERASML
jgi:uncharacterized protein DUF6962